DKALALLQWKPTLNFEQTASFTAQWYNNYYNSSNFDAKAFTQAQIDSYVAIASNLKHSWTI
ncbi:MAG: CDP-glucose 4,6-dehydratase, partial [Bacteroidetes bacterium]|nr:CDP-glucose 4,6-dehydratase [Bacteroidota bacterium]